MGERIGKSLQQVEHIHGHLWYRYPVSVNQRSNVLSITQCFSYGFCSFEEGYFSTFSQRSHARLYIAVVVILTKSTEISDDNTVDHVNGKIPFIFLQMLWKLPIIYIQDMLLELDRGDGVTTMICVCLLEIHGKCYYYSNTNI